MGAQGPRDILGELFQGDQDFTAVPGLEELDALIHACVGPRGADRLPAGERKLLTLPKKRRSGTRKATHYLEGNVYEGLTLANVALKKLLPDGTKSRASKSRLVNYAVSKLLHEIEKEGESSAVIKDILNDAE